MNSNTDDEPGKHQERDDIPDKALEKLEEMWDRKILKGDDDFFDSRSRSGGKADSTDNTEQVKPKRKRIGRIN
jgi:hypothetical protein